jgi:hypothetical protein
MCEIYEDVLIFEGEIMSKWMELYNRKRRPILEDMQNFWPKHILELF